MSSPGRGILRGCEDRRRTCAGFRVRRLINAAHPPHSTPLYYIVNTGDGTPCTRHASASGSHPLDDATPMPYRTWSGLHAGVLPYRLTIMSLDELRKQIDTLDSQIVELLNQRAEIVVQIGRSRAPRRPDLRPGSGARGTRKGPHREPRSAARQHDRRNLPRADERVLRTGEAVTDRVPRPEGSYSHLAAMGKFGSSVEYEAVADIRGSSRRSCGRTPTSHRAD